MLLTGEIYGLINGHLGNLEEYYQPRKATAALVGLLYPSE